jgi:hypothetical protein
LHSDLKSVQPARCRLCPSAWSSGIGAPIYHCRLCGSIVAILPGSPWCLGADVHPLWMGVGLLEAATVFRDTTAGVACLPKLCAALRLKTFEAWPDARCGPVRGKAVTEDSSSLRRRYQRTTGAWCWWVRPPSGCTIWRPGNGNASVAVTSTTSNDSVRDSLPDKIENSLLISSQNHQSLNTVWK